MNPEQQHRRRHPRPPSPRSGDRDVLPEPRQPALGDLVHFSSYPTNGGEYGKECRAAVVTKVRSTSGLSLIVFGPSSVEFVTYVSAHHLGPDADSRSEHRSGTWHWPDDEGGADHA